MTNLLTENNLPGGLIYKVEEIYQKVKQKNKKLESSKDKNN